jgi:hypothetical protein
MCKRDQIKRLSLFLFLSLFALAAMAQEEGEENPHRITFLLSHTWINTVAPDGEKFGALPSFGLNYDYWFSEKFAIGLHNDFIAETFVIERLDGEANLERELPWAAVVVAIYKFENGLAPLVGAGVEIEKTESLPLLHVGLEYGKEFAEVWEVGANLTYDFKWDAYNSYAFGLSVSRKL